MLMAVAYSPYSAGIKTMLFINKGKPQGFLPGLARLELGLLSSLTYYSQGLVLGRHSLA